MPCMLNIFILCSYNLESRLAVSFSGAFFWMVDVNAACQGSKCQKASICADLLIVSVISILIRQKMMEHKIGLFLMEKDRGMTMD